MQTNLHKGLFHSDTQSIYLKKYLSSKKVDEFGTAVHQTYCN